MSTTNNREAELAEKIKGSRVLLVEDNILMQQVAKSLLNDAEVDVDLASNGKEAIELLLGDENRLTGNQLYDIVLMDIQMPEMDGCETTKAIRAYEKGSESHIPIIAMTAHAMKGYREKCKEVGMDDYVTKPIEAYDYYSAIARWIKPRNPNSETEHSEIKTRPPKSRVSDSGFQMPDTLPGINIKSFLKRLGGDSKLFRTVLKEFFNGYANVADEIRNSLKNNDIEAALLLAHTLKGVAGNISADELRRAAFDLEHGIMQENASVPDSLINSFEDALAKVLESVENLVQKFSEYESSVHEPETEKTDIAELADQDIAPMLIELAGLVLENDFSSESYLNSVKPYLAAFGVQEQIELLESQLYSFDFKNARKTLAEVGEKAGVSLGDLFQK
ncbi:MAG: response regulator [Desulfobacterales bacterium]|nr:response regulator [Desulfobacterales bacterium]